MQCSFFFVISETVKLDVQTAIAYGAYNFPGCCVDRTL